MTAIEFLAWVRGPAFQIATVIFMVGVLIRLLEIIMLGRKPNLAEPRGSAAAGGARTLVSRMLPDADSLQRSSFTIITGYVFHIGLFVTLFLFAPHILLFQDLTGLSWPALPTPVVDATAVITLIALAAVLIYRLRNPVQRFLSRFEDYLVWLVTVLPLLTGYLAFHRIGATPPMLLALHILSVQLLMVLFPFTKLMHAFTLFLARWYNGSMAGYKGVQS